MNTNNNYALTALNINKYLNSTHILKNVSLKLKKGNIYAIVGPSGCGKSSLLYILGLLDTPKSGTIWINDKQIQTFDDKNRTLIRNNHIGFVFQFHFLLYEFTAIENVMLPMKNINKENYIINKDKAFSYLKEVGLEHKCNRFANELSGGEQQRVAIARALANSPNIILADEPTGNLDTKNSDIAFELLQKLSIMQNKAILIVTHNELLAKKCNYIFYMNDGEIVNFQKNF